MPGAPGSPPRRCALSESPRRRPAVFLDRDGTISEEVGYLKDAGQFRMFPFAAGAIRRLNEANLPVFVVTNQSGVGRGYFPESMVNTIHELMTRQLATTGAHLKAIYYCPHTADDECACRKPKPALLERAASEYQLDLQRSFVVGDRYGDIALAHGVRSRGILVRTGYGEQDLRENGPAWPVQPEFVAVDLAAAVDWILDHTRF